MAASYELALCLRRQDWSETSQTVSLLTRTLGLVRGLVKGAKRQKGAFSGGLELLTLGEVGLITKSDRELATITDWDLREVFPALRSDLLAHSIGIYLADVLLGSLATGDPHPRLFDQTIATLRLAGALRTDRTARWQALLDFQRLLLEEIGYRPILDADAETGERLDLADERQTLVFRPASGGLSRRAGGADAWRVRPSTIRTLITPQPASPTSEQALTRANRLLAAYLSYVLDRDSTAAAMLFGRAGESV